MKVTISCVDISGKQINLEVDTKNLVIKTDCKAFCLSGLTFNLCDQGITAYTDSGSEIIFENYENTVENAFKKNKLSGQDQNIFYQAKLKEIEELKLQNKVLQQALEAYETK